MSHSTVVRSQSAAPIEPASARESIPVLLASIWLTVGLFVDAYAHERLLRGDESFLTPWHAVFYTGYLATLLAVGRMALMRAGPGRRPMDWLPEGYRLSGVGVAVFACGGVGDAIWHTRFGFERATEALYSPTHLLLMVGLVLIVTGPFRAAVAVPTSSLVSWAQYWSAHVSLSLAVAVVAYFSPWALYSVVWYRVEYDPETGIGDIELNAALGAEVATTVVLIGAVLLITARWRPPVGACTLLFATTAGLFTLSSDGSVRGALAALVGGACIDLVLSWRRPPGTVDHGHRILVAAFVGPFVMWAAWHLLLAAGGDLAWRAPVAAGTPLFAGFAGLAMAAVARPATARTP